ncbi:uncharacterized protein LOC143104494 [Alosa pseudoharengus]|uniref:uncharacterized protein LOC143104494 n=1 Tax=Alosa pseudoharengus TaxID=34774 RepID=UPI003F8CF183
MSLLHVWDRARLAEVNLKLRKHAAALEDISSLEKVVRELQHKEDLEKMKIKDPIGLLLHQKRMELVQMENLTQRMRQLERENQHLKQDMETRREMERIHQSNMMELERKMKMLEQVSGQQKTSLHSINEEMSQRLRKLETGNLIMNEEMKAWRERELQMNIKMKEQQLLSQHEIASIQKINEKLLQTLRKLETENWTQKQERALEIQLKMEEQQLLSQQQIVSLQKTNDKLLQRMSNMEMENWRQKEQMETWRARELQEREMGKCNAMKELERNNEMKERLLLSQREIESFKTMNEKLLQRMKELETDNWRQKQEMETWKERERKEIGRQEPNGMLDAKVQENLLKDEQNMNDDRQRNGRKTDEKWQGLASETDKNSGEERSRGDGRRVLETGQIVAMETTARANSENTLLKSPLHGDHLSPIVGNGTAKCLPPLQDMDRDQPHHGSKAAMETSMKRKKKTNRQKATEKRKEKEVKQLEMDRQKTEKEKEMRDEQKEKATLIQRLEEERQKALAEVAAMMRKGVLK